MRDPSCSATAQHEPNLFPAQPSGDTGEIVHVRRTTWSEWPQTAILLDSRFDPLAQMLEGGDGGGVVHGRRGFVWGNDSRQLDMVM
jgi:hypothetical protein